MPTMRSSVIIHEPDGREHVIPDVVALHLLAGGKLTIQSRVKGVDRTVTYMPGMWSFATDHTRERVVAKAYDA